MKKKLQFLLIFAILLVTLLPITVSADVGPKPSVSVKFLNLENQMVYCTLLSEYDSTGPYSAYNENHPIKNVNVIPEEIWKAFYDYKDKDNFYFLQYGHDINLKGKFEWGYRPPDTFKILLYFSKTNTYRISDVQKRYAFDSYYLVDLAKTTGSENDLVVESSYDFARELLSFLARLALTVAVEILIALFFGIKAKKQLRLLLIVNIVTQLILNLLLNIVTFNGGMFYFAVSYILFELIVFAIEAPVYASKLNEHAIKPRKPYYYVLYAFIANLMSLIIGEIIFFYIVYKLN